LYLCDKNNVYKTFSSPFLHNKKLPKPKTIIRKGKKKTWGISAFPSIDYSRENNLIFALTTMGWRELAEENDLFRAVIIFDEEGNTLCEHKIEPFKGGEDSICFHEASNTLFYFSYGCIKVYKIKK
ncbi:MAG: hypothetical protein KGY74_08860, partial [Candidatus Cloacimonetes bacterium]|nr:hypothetical protein [Candidatus Cloacimonadota bacterium]